MDYPPGPSKFYQNELNRLCDFLEGMNIAHVKHVEACHLRAYLLHLGETRNPGGIHAAYRAMKAFFRWWDLETQPDHWRNPILKLRPPKVPQEKWRECWDEIRKQTTDSLSAEKVRRGVASRRRAHVLRRIVFGLAGSAVAAAILAAVLLWPGAPVEPPVTQEADSTVCVTDYDDANYNLHIIDKPGYTIIRLIPVSAHEGG